MSGVLNDVGHWPNDALDRIQRELAGAETPLYLVADDILRVLEAAEAVPLRSTPMVSAEQQREALEEIIANLSVPSHPAAWVASALKVARARLAALPND